MTPEAPRKVVEIHCDTGSYRAVQFPTIYRPSYAGAAPVTRYFVYSYGWQPVEWEQLPPKVYRALRKALREETFVAE
jgi:hypothetical protein